MSVIPKRHNVGTAYQPGQYIESCTAKLPSQMMKITRMVLRAIDNKPLNVAVPDMLYTTAAFAPECGGEYG